MSNLENQNNDQDSDYIKISDLLLSIKRQYKIFIITALFLSTIGFFRAIRSKPTWKGEFQILLTLKQNQTLEFGNKSLGILNIGSKANEDLNTEVAILESPLVLLPVFNLYKEITNNTDQNLRLRNFTSGINIELEEGTSLLNVSYINKNKDIILPILEKISQGYQDYSQRDKKRQYQNSLAYLNEQIAIYTVKSKNTLSAAQKYAIKHDLTPLKGDSAMDREIKTDLYMNGLSTREALNSDLLSMTPAIKPFNVEFERVRAAYDVKLYKKKIEQLQKLEDEDSIFILGKTERFVGKLPITKKIEDINIKIDQLKSIFKEDDPKLLEAKKLKKTYQIAFKNELYGYLKARLMDAQAEVAASERPEGVLVIYRELLRESIRDEEFLKKLELDRQVVLLERSMIIDPWELISNPTVLQNPISLSKKNLFLYWIIFGVFSGSIFAILKEKINDYIFNKEILIKKIPYKLLAILDKNKIDGWEEEIFTPIKLSKDKLFNNKEVNLIPIGEHNDERINTIFDTFKINFTPTISNKLNSVPNNKINIIVIELGSIKNKDIKEILEKISIYNLNINNWILIN